MKKRGGIALSLAVLASAALASSAGAGSSATAASAVSCKGTFKIALMTPLTGDAGFLGQEQLSWSKYAVKRLAPVLGLKVQLLQGDTPARAGRHLRRRWRRSTSPTRGSWR